MSSAATAGNAGGSLPAAKNPLFGIAVFLANVKIFLKIYIKPN